jgi:hypothetical protein
MKTVHIFRIQKAALARKPGYIEAVQKVGKPITIRGQPFVQFSDADHAALATTFAIVKPVIVPSSPLPPSPEPFGLGDAIHKVALPIARALKLDCIDPATRQPKPDSKCAQRRAALNKITKKN